MPAAHEHFSEQFQKWERRGRGWQVFLEPVWPEPPFVPFAYRAMTDTPIVDNGSRPSFLGSLFRKLAVPPATPQPEAEIEPEAEPKPTPLTRNELVELQVCLPADFDAPKETVEHFFSSLSLCREPIAFELLGIHKKVITQFAAAANDVPLVRRQLQSHFPEAQLKPCQNSLLEAWNTGSGNEALAVEFGLGREFMFSLADIKSDPFVGIIGALSEFEEGELGLFQVLWQPAREDWPQNIMASVTDHEGKPLFINRPELTAAAEKKVSKPLFAAVVRIATKAGTFERALQIAADMAGALRTFADPQGNNLIPLKNDDYPLADHVADVVYRQSRRSGMILSGDELVGFVHLPSSDVQSPALLRNSGATKAASAIVRQPGLLIGDNEHLDEVVPVSLSADQRVRHTHIIGVSGSGKSSLLFNMIRQDIEKGEGVAVLDPHGDLIDQLLGIIPENRIDDVVLLDTSDGEFPVGFNILQAHSEDEKNLLASDLIAVFRRLSTSWGDQMDAVMQNAILAFLNSTRGGTLKDLQRFLLDKPPFRKEFLQTVQDSEVFEFWNNVFPQMTGVKSIPSVLTRLQDFFSRKTLRYMVSQRQNKLDFADIMDSGKIFLAKLPEGLCGEENIYLLGTLLVSKFQQLAMARQSQAAANRKHFWLYIDEFDHFITPSMAKILSGARKYRLGMTLAHQQLHQLQDDPKVAAAVMTQPCTRIVFHFGDEDARKLRFASFEAEQFKTLKPFHTLARVESDDLDFNLAIRKPAWPDEQQAKVRREKVIAASRSKYATPRTQVEAALLAAARGERPTPPSNTTPTPPIVPAQPKIQTSPISEPPKVSEVPKVAISSEDADEEGQHNAIKERIRVQAETLDYSVTFEEFVADSQGRADVVLRRGNRSIACEITVTTPVEYEVANLTKCLSGKFGHVAAISRNRRKLERIRQLLAETVSPEQTANVGFYLPEEFISKLHDWSMDDPDGGAMERGKPRKRKIAFDTAQLTGAERKQREEDMLNSLTEAMKRR